MIGRPLLIIIALGWLTWAGPAAAQTQINCGAEPRDVPIEVQEQLKGDIQGKAQLFTRLLGDAQLQGAIDSTRHEVNEKHQNLDQSQLDRYMLWTMCQAILADKTLTSQEKVEQYLRVYKTLRPGSSQSEPPTYDPRPDIRVIGGYLNTPNADVYISDGSIAITRKAGTSWDWCCVGDSLSDQGSTYQAKLFDIGRMGNGFDCQKTWKKVPNLWVWYPNLCVLDSYAFKNPPLSKVIQLRCSAGSCFELKGADGHLIGRRADVLIQHKADSAETNDELETTLTRLMEHAKAP
jgi:hypothetical protein